MVPAERTVTVGLGHGKRAAREIDAWLRPDPGQRPPKHPPKTFDMGRQGGGLDLPYSCRTGHRGTGEAAAVAGEVTDTTDTVLTTGPS